MSRKTGLEVELEYGEYFEMQLLKLNLDKKMLLFDEGEKLLLFHLIDHLKFLKYDISGYMISVYSNLPQGFVWYGNDPIDRTISVSVEDM
jgi:hypothetical protein